MQNNNNLPSSPFTSNNLQQSGNIGQFWQNVQGAGQHPFQVQVHRIPPHPPSLCPSKRISQTTLSASLTLVAFQYHRAVHVDPPPAPYTSTSLPEALRMNT